MSNLYPAINELKDLAEVDPKMITSIIIDLDTLELLNKFYHNTSSIGKLEITLIDQNIIGRKTNNLSIVTEKYVDQNTANTLHEFYYAFTESKNVAREK